MATGGEEREMGERVCEQEGEENEKGMHECESARMRMRTKHEGTGRGELPR
jgi:hypothetical protein